MGNSFRSSFSCVNLGSNLMGLILLQLSVSSSIYWFSPPFLLFFIFLILEISSLRYNLACYKPNGNAAGIGILMEFKDGERFVLRETSKLLFILTYEF